MTDPSVRAGLLRACDDIERVLEFTSTPEPRDRLEGIAEQLRYLARGGGMDPEARTAPDRDSLDTMETYLTEIMAGTDDEETVERLEQACNEIAAVVETLDERWRRQHGITRDTG